MIQRRLTPAPTNKRLATTIDTIDALQTLTYGLAVRELDVSPIDTDDEVIGDLGEKIKDVSDAITSRDPDRIGPELAGLILKTLIYAAHQRISLGMHLSEQVAAAARRVGALS